MPSERSMLLNACFLVLKFSFTLSSSIIIIVNFLCTGNSTCVFAARSPLYTSQLRDALRPVDTLVSSCADLADYWTYLIGLMSLCFVGFILSGVAIISNCILPCVEGRYDKETAV